MPTSYIGLFMALVLINHVATLRIAAADELSQKTLTCVPLCSGLLTGLTLVISITLLNAFKIYASVIPVLNLLDHFMYVLVMAFVAHLLCMVCFKLKPLRVISNLFPIIVLNSIGLGLLVPTIHFDFTPIITALIIATVFIIAANLFYYGNLCFNNIASSKKLSITLLMAGLFALLFYGLIAFH